METDFDHLNFHDSHILKLELLLDMSDLESFSVWIDYIENYNTHKTSVRRLTFEDCREIRLINHLGFVRNNSIAEAGTLLDSDLLNASETAWRNVGLVSTNWKHFYMTTNTGSRLDVIAAGFYFE